ncbi:MAG: DnaJ family molecular chaperone [Aquamicrobium sp.]|nr:DnaJ family molecular chaperone [Aquamicrobium sp.]
MSIWARISEFLSTVPANALSNLIEAVRTVFEGDPELRRRVAFSIAMIALSAKMAKADGIVTQAEVRAFQQIFEVPRDQARNVARLFDLAKQDVAGFELYAERMARLCGSGQPNCAMLEDILDGLFHIAKADGFVHEREVAFLHRVAEIFEIDEQHFERILSRHAILGEKDPWLVLGIERGTPFEEVRARYRRMVAENHPDRLIARGVPEEFLAIANSRLAAINGAYETIERSMQRT